MASAQASVASPTLNPVRHLHAVGDTCPLCEQAIPHDRADEIAERLEARERQQSEAITSRLSEAFALEKTEALEAARLETAQKVEVARQEAGAAVEARLKAQVEEATQAKATVQAALDAKIQEADTAQTLLRGELDRTKRESETAIEQLKREGAEREIAARNEATQAATTAAAAKIEAAEGEKLAAVAASAAAQAALEEARQSGEAALTKLQLEADQREATARLEATSAAQTAVAEQLAAAEQAKVAAEGKAQEAEAMADGLKQTHQAELTARLDEQRLALEAAQTTALNAERSSAFEERQKLSNKVEELQRALEKKSNEELGEGAEIVVFEALKAEFPGDKIERIVKGQAGADIRHVVMHNGRECGKIIYDSKNHNAWRNEFVTKLKADQLADRADHAVLSTHKFPAGGKQLLVQDGVVIAGPARVVALVQMIRAHLIHAHTLRMSNDARAQKTDALYTFITSQQCADQFARLDEHAEALLKIQEKEMKAHQAVWTQQGITIRAAMKVQAEMRNQIDSIIGTASAPESEG
ncbi:MAG: hypothetical protein JNL41_01355 [Phenylobacterium sp.]|uniref:DUF2130 domain-containing protein n=1 Tax=Phenylobacterium sp. TaxID=1871053 RepID=UPI001A578542|nr:DUF2130 domain-containing protein [Phenylobacterium sp.]MBL8552895.1 hypothetical protein [Phenylobacterium sp.]